MSHDVGTMDDEALLGFARLPIDLRRFAVYLANAVQDAELKWELPADEVRNLVFLALEQILLQQKRAPIARKELSRVLGPALEDIEPVPFGTVEQARRLASLRATLLKTGAVSIATMAIGRDLTSSAARQWVSRSRKAHRIFTVAHDGETLIPAFLLDKALDPKPGAQAPIRLLQEVGEDGWSLWAWFALPSPWLGGRIAAELLDEEPQTVAEAARQRAASAA